MRKEGLAPEISERIELLALLIETGESKLSAGSALVNNMSDSLVNELLLKQRARMSTQLEAEKFTREKNEAEPAEKEIGIPGGYAPSSSKTAGGGRRIIRKGYTMQG